MTVPNDWKRRVQGDVSLKKENITEKYKTGSRCKRRNQNKSRFIKKKKGRFILDSAEISLRYHQREASQCVSITTIQEIKKCSCEC